VWTHQTGHQGNGNPRVRKNRPDYQLPNQGEAKTCGHKINKGGNETSPIKTERVIVTGEKERAESTEALRKKDVKRGGVGLLSWTEAPRAICRSEGPA